MTPPVCLFHSFLEHTSCTFNKPLRSSWKNKTPSPCLILLNVYYPPSHKPGVKPIWSVSSSRQRLILEDQNLSQWKPFSLKINKYNVGTHRRLNHEATIGIISFLHYLFSRVSVIISFFILLCVLMQGIYCLDTNNGTIQKVCCSVSDILRVCVAQHHELYLPACTTRFGVTALPPPHSNLRRGYCYPWASSFHGPPIIHIAVFSLWTQSHTLLHFTWW